MPGLLLLGFGAWSLPLTPRQCLVSCNAHGCPAFSHAALLSTLSPPFRARVEGVRTADTMTMSSGDSARWGGCPPRWPWWLVGGSGGAATCGDWWEGETRGQPKRQHDKESEGVRPKDWETCSTHQAAQVDNLCHKQEAGEGCEVAPPMAAQRGASHAGARSGLHSPP